MTRTIEQIIQDLIEEIIWMPTDGEAKALGVPHMIEIRKMKEETLRRLIDGQDHPH